MTHAALPVIAVVALSAVGAGLGVAALARPHGGSGPAAPTRSGAGGAARLSCSAPAGLPGSRVEVTVSDMGMTGMRGGPSGLSARMLLRASPASVPPGRVSIVVSNVGQRRHELVVLPLATGREAGRRRVGSDRKVDEAGSLGEASVSCAGGAGEGIASGTVGWTTVDLQPGRYEVLCNLENHYAAGMWQELDVA